MKTVRKTIGALSLFAAAFFLFAGCTDLSGNAKSKSSKDSVYTLSGKLSLGTETGALPRTATISTNTSILIDTNKMKITASNGTKTATGQMSGQFNYYIELPAVGDWTIEFNYDNKALYGKIAVSVDANSEELEPQDVILKPNFDADRTGAIDLEINVDDVASIKTLKCVAEPLGDLSDGVLTDAQELKLSSTLEISGTKFTLKSSNVPAGSYDVSFDFMDATGNSLYMCKEIINVFSGLTTNTWYGNCPYLSSSVGGGKTSFTITNDVLETFAAELVPSTKYVLYEPVYDEETQDFIHNSFYLCDSLMDSTSGEPDFTSQVSSFCFDADGNVRVYGASDGPATIKTIGSDDTIILKENSYGNLYSFDSKTKVLYSLSSYGIYQMTDDNGEFESVDECAPTKYYVLTTSNDDENAYLQQSSNFVVHDGVAYIAGVHFDSDMNAGYNLQYDYLAVVDLKTAVLDEDNPAQYSTTVSKRVNNIVSGLGITSKGGNDFRRINITDMLYQDGAVYMLLKDYNLKDYDNHDCYSRGALIRYDTFTETIKTVGFSDEESEIKNVKLRAYYGNYTLYTDEGCENPLLVSTNTSCQGSYLYNYLSPSKICTPAPFESSSGNPVLSKNSFYGPSKFLAIKPKKLVIADEGIAFYTDSDNALKYKNVNRVVIVDLDSFTINTDEITNVAVSFEDEGSDTVSCSASTTGYSIPETIGYYKTGDTAEPVASVTINIGNGQPSGYRYGIPCGD